MRYILEFFFLKVYKVQIRTPVLGRINGEFPCRNRKIFVEPPNPLQETINTDASRHSLCAAQTGWNIAKLWILGLEELVGSE